MSVHDFQQKRYTLSTHNNGLGMHRLLSYGVATQAWAVPTIVDNIGCKCEIMAGWFYGGIFKGGIFKGGNFYDGWFSGGKFVGGNFYGGSFNDGLYVGAEFYAGQFNESHEVRSEHYGNWECEWENYRCIN